MRMGCTYLDENIGLLKNSFQYSISLFTCFPLIKCVYCSGGKISDDGFEDW